MTIERSPTLSAPDLTPGRSPEYRQLIRILADLNKSPVFRFALMNVLKIDSSGRSL
ncbi:hypothetical protein [Planktothricoides raciborskii]|uniref:Uncharacterized protein n=1 Tax=Planktothricoides raciborskii GIHE-MW2 TaxID=2792601 RepID=A0AAU8JC08_9CYAN